MKTQCVCVFLKNVFPYIMFHAYFFANGTIFVLFTCCVCSYLRYCRCCVLFGTVWGRKGA